MPSLFFCEREESAAGEETAALACYCLGELLLVSLFLVRIECMQITVMKLPFGEENRCENVLFLLLFKFLLSLL